MVESQKKDVNGLAALAMIADQQSEQQQEKLRTLIYIISHDKNMYVMLGASALQTFNSYAPTFERSMESFKRLTDTEKINRKPERVRVKTVQQSGTLSSVLKYYKTPDKRLEELAVLNGMQLADRVEKGTLIKIIDQ